MSYERDVLSFQREPPPFALPEPSDPNFLKEVKRALERLMSPHAPLADRALRWRDAFNAQLVNIIDIGGNPMTPSPPPAPVTPPSGPVTDVPPPDPTGLAASAALTTIFLEWDENDPTRVAYTEVWAAPVSDATQRVMVGTSIGRFFAHAVGATGVTRYYWIRNVGYSSGNAEPLKSNFNGVGGTPATTGKIGNSDLGPLIVEAVNIANNAVITQKIADAAIQAAKIAQNAVTANAIAAGAVVTSKLFVVPETLIPDPLFRDTAWWTESLYDPNGWYFEDADPSFGGGAGNLPAQMGVARAAVLFDGITGGVGNTRKHVWSAAVPFSGVGQELRLRARIRNDSNQWVAVAVRFYDIDGNTLGPDIRVQADAGTGLQTLSVIGTAPAATARFRVIVYNQGGSTFTGIAGVSEVKLDIAAGGEMIVDGAVTANKIDANAVVADKIAANAIGAVHILAGAITSDKITTGAVTADKIGANEIDAVHLRANSVTAQKIAANQIGTAHLQAEAVTAEKVLAGSLTADRFTTSAQGRGPMSMLVNSDWTEYAGTNSGIAALPGWEMYNAVYSGFGINRNFLGGTAWNLGRGGCWLHDNAAGQGGEWGINQLVNVVENTLYEVSIKGSLHRCGGRIAINWGDVNGQFISQSSIAFPNPGSGVYGSINQLEWLAWALVTAPAGARSARAYAIKNVTPAGQADSYAFFHEFHFAPAPPGASSSNRTPYRHQGAVEISGGGIRTDSIDVEKLRAGSISTSKWLQSEGYVPATTGWRINGDGTAEFSNVRVRGDVQASSIQADTVTATTIVGGEATRFTSATVQPGTAAVPNLTSFDITLPGVNYTADRADSMFLMVGHLHLNFRVLALLTSGSFQAIQLEVRPVLDTVSADNPVWFGEIGGYWSEAFGGSSVDVRTTIPIVLTWARPTTGAKTIAMRTLVALKSPNSVVISQRGWSMQATIIEFKRQLPGETQVTIPRVVTPPVFA